MKTLIEELQKRIVHLQGLETFSASIQDYGMAMRLRAQWLELQSTIYLAEKIMSERKVAV